MHLYTHIHVTIYMARFPCFFAPLAEPLFAPFLCPLYLLGTLLAVTGSVHLGLRLLINWPPLSQPFPIPSQLQVPSTQVNKRLITTTSWIRLLLSRTLSSISPNVPTDITPPLFSKASFITPPRPTTKGFLRNYFSQTFFVKSKCNNFRIFANNHSFMKLVFWKGYLSKIKRNEIKLYLNIQYKKSWLVNMYM